MLDFVSPAPRPDGKIVMRPRWRDLLFLHWDFPPDEIQKLLPDGLEVDTFGERAWVGLVPFRMENVRPHFLPDLGKFGAFYDRFPELNVRTYVVRDGVPGVWFFSLDASSALGVLTARSWFALPYFKARMRLWRTRNGQIRFHSTRLWPSPKSAFCSVRFRPQGEISRAKVGSLEAFLVERYALYSLKNGQYFRGRVWHEPYEIQTAKIEFLRENCLQAAGISRPNQTPHVLFSRGVGVEVWGLEKC